MNAEIKQIRGKHLAALAIVFVVAALSWMFYFANVLVIDYLSDNWHEWYGVRFYDSPWQYIPINLTVNLGPMIVLLGLAILFYRRFYYLNFSSLHEANLRELSKAKAALRQGLESVAVIEREYKGKIETFEQLKVQLDELQSVKNIDTQDLRKKLNAIALANRHLVWFDRFIAFVIGVVSSLIASYVWDHLR